MENKSEVGILTTSGENYDIAMKVIDEVLKTFKDFFSMELNYALPSVEMFLNHLQLMSQRVATQKILNDIDDEVMYRNLAKVYKDVDICVNEVVQKLKEKFDCELTFTEKLYLLVHMQNILNVKK